ncbi:TetR/AcrR family transcriptional regulator [Gallaecimonas xiamenensis]|nr:TetR/AcrR family transcriptional regulator [Gallaecimonas xiamenensis]
MRPSTQAKQAKFLAEATELFFEQGYEGTNLDQLIERCGGSKQTLYRYFGDKQGLLKAVVANFTEQAWQVIELKDAKGPALRQQLVEFGCRYRTLLNSAQLAKLFRLLIARVNQDPELIGFFLDRTVRYSQQLLSQHLAQLVEQGALVLADPELASDQFLAALRGRSFIEALLVDLQQQESAASCRHHAEAAVTWLLGDATSA